MLTYIRPNIFSSIKTEKEFESKFADPIMKGVASDASIQANFLSLKALKELTEIIDPYVHRKDASE